MSDVDAVVPLFVLDLADNLLLVMLFPSCTRSSGENAELVGAREAEGRVTWSRTHHGEQSRKRLWDDAGVRIRSFD